MSWLDKFLYTTEYEQSQWSVEQWRKIWAQITRVIEDACINLTDEDLFGLDIKEKKRLEWHLRRKKYAEHEIESWDIIKMSTKMQVLIKACMMQNHKYNYFLRTFKNLVLIDKAHLNKEWDLRLNKGVEPLNWYYNLGIRI